MKAQDVIKKNIERFKEKKNELIQETHWGDETDSPVHEFGYKTQKKTHHPTFNDPNGIMTELFTIVDWGNIEKDIEHSHTSLTQAILEDVKEIKRTPSDITQLTVTEKGIAEEKLHYQRECGRGEGHIQALSQVQEYLKKLI